MYPVQLPTSRDTVALAPLLLVCAVLFCLAAPFLLLAWLVRRPLVRRATAACVLLLCKPRTKGLDGKLYTLCYPDHA